MLREGLNCLKPTEWFNRNSECGPGGLYFCRKEDVGHWLLLYGDELGFISAVTLCHDSTVVSVGAKLKADRFILGPFHPIESFLATETMFTMAALRQDGLGLQFVPEAHRTLEHCWAAVNQYGLALEFVPAAIQTPELCWAAVQSTSEALQYVRKRLRTPELCLAAVQKDGWSFNSVPDTSKTIETRGCSIFGLVAPVCSGKDSGNMSCRGTSGGVCAPVCSSGPTNAPVHFVSLQYNKPPGHFSTFQRPYKRPNSTESPYKHPQSTHLMP